MNELQHGSSAMKPTPEGVARTGGKNAVEPSPGADENVEDLIEEVDDPDEEGGERPDQTDVVPGSDAASDAESLGVVPDKEQRGQR